MNTSDYLKTTELAMRLHVHRQTIRNWTKIGKIHPAISYGRVVRYEWAQVLKDLGYNPKPLHSAFREVR